MNAGKMPSEISEIRQRFQQIKDKCFINNKKANPDRISLFTLETDKLLHSVYSSRVEKNSQNKDICMIALGGYGRKELCPYSDIDLLILYNSNSSKPAIEKLVRTLWDLGLPIGCVVRTLSECSQILGQEIETDTAFLQARYLDGNHNIYEKLINSIIKPYFKRRKNKYINDIRKEIITRIFNPSQTIFHIEPDIKNGICGLRDCHRILWSEQIRTEANTIEEIWPLSYFDTEEIEKFFKAYQFLLNLRTEMHLFYNRRIDIMEAVFQESIAKRMNFNEAGYLLEAYFKNVKSIKSFAASFIDKSNLGERLMVRLRRKIASTRINENIYFIDGIFYPIKTAILSLKPLDILNIFNLSQQYQANLSHDFCNIIRNSVVKIPSANFISEKVYYIFRKILSHRSPGQTLIQLFETDVLAKIIPEFSNLICKVEYDTYHEYTTDQHTLLMTAGLDDIMEQTESDLYKIYSKIKNKFLLRLSFLLHDIGKSLPGDHCKNGAIIAARIGSRLGLEPKEVNRVQFLVFNHLLLSQFTFTYEWDKEDIRKIAIKIKNKSNLDMLYLLTVMDIKNVGSKTWTEWKGVQLKELYAEVLKNLGLIDAANKDINDEEIYSYSFFDSDRHNHELWIKRFKENSIKSGLHLYPEEFIGFTRITVVGNDKKNFFTDIVSCISSEGYNILSAKIVSTEDGVVLDIFHLEPDIQTNLNTENRINNIKKKWEMINTGETDSFKLISNRLKNYPVPVSGRTKNEESFVFINNRKSDIYTVLEVKTRDRFGLLFKIAQILNEFSINIVSAKLSTRIDRAVDTFNITTLNREKIDNPTIINDLEKALRKQLV